MCIRDSRDTVDVTLDTSRLCMTRETRRISVLDHIRMGEEPGFIGVAAGVMTCVAVAAGFSCRLGLVAQHATIVFDGCGRMVRFQPTFGVGHVQTMTRVAELLLFVTRRARGFCVEKGDAVRPSPIRVQMARWPGNHREGVTG